MMKSRHAKPRSKRGDQPLDIFINPDCGPRSLAGDPERLPRLDLDDNYTVLKELGTGTYGRVVLAGCHRTGDQVALKLFPKTSTRLRDFVREFNIAYYLSPHAAVLNTFDVAFETPTNYVFAQELAPLGDLFDLIEPQSGLSEPATKTVCRQIGSALEFMHNVELIHRDVKPENILVFDDQFNRVKLMDFGMTKRAHTAVRKVSPGIPYTPPEICDIPKGGRYTVESAADVWAFGVLIFCVLTGSFPWECAHAPDTYYMEFRRWQRRRTGDPPPNWRRFSSKLLRLLAHFLDVRRDRRASINELSKYIDYQWLV